VSLDAAKAADLVEDWLERTGGLPTLGPVSEWEREVPHGSHRIDFRLELADGRSAWLEVKSLSLAEGTDAFFSRTPSMRGISHLEALGDCAESGLPAACAFVVQRGDVLRLVADPDADPGWLEALRRAAARGVELIAFACRVKPQEVSIARPIPVLI
jgi:sugar fermentation stimulation protein A